MMNKGTVYALWDHEAQSPDELSFRDGDALTVLKRRDESETEWWWARLNDKEGYVPRNLLGVSTRIHLRINNSHRGHTPMTVSDTLIFCCIKDVRINLYLFSFFFVFFLYSYTQELNPDSAPWHSAP